MARNANIVRNIFTPAFNNSKLGLVAAGAVVMYILLMFPMLKSEFHDPHVEFDNFATKVFGWGTLFCCKGRNAGEDYGENYQG